MPSFELNKSIEVRKLNKRSRLLLSEPPVTIPYGALVENIEQDNDNDQFVYLGELYQCTHSLLSSALGNSESLPSTSVAPAGVKAQDVRVRWEELRSDAHRTWRTKLPGGWLIAVGSGDNKGAAFYPDPDHLWDGRTLE